MHTRQSRKGMSMAGELEFFLDGERIEPSGHILREFTDFDTDHLIITVKNNTPRQVHSMSLLTDLPIDFELPEVLMAGEESSITLTINGEDLMDYVPKTEPRLEFKWKELIK